MSSMTSSAMTTSRICENAEECVAYAQLGEPARLSRYNDDEVCSACRERRLDAEVAAASEVPRRRYGTGSIYQQPTGGWRGRYTDKNGRRCSISAPTREEVEARLAAAVAERGRSKKREEHVAEANGGPAVRQMLEQMMETLVAAESVGVLAQLQETQKALAETLERAQELLVRLEKATGKLEAKEGRPCVRAARPRAERQGGGHERHYTVQEAASLVCIHPDHVYKMIKAGEMHAVKFGPRRTRIPESSLRVWMEQRTAEYGAA